MKRSDKLIMAIYLIVGILLLVTGLIIQTDYYSTLLFATGFGLTVSTLVQLFRFYRNTRPENIEQYQEKVRRQDILLKDERKVQLRNRAGYLTWVLTMLLCFLGSFAGSWLHVEAKVVVLLAVFALAQYLAASLIYWYLCRKL